MQELQKKKKILGLNLLDQLESYSHAEINLSDKEDRKRSMPKSGSRAYPWSLNDALRPMHSTTCTKECQGMLSEEDEMESDRSNQ